MQDEFVKGTCQGFMELNVNNNDNNNNNNNIIIIIKNFTQEVAITHGWFSDETCP